VQIDSTVTVGVNDTSYDVKFFGATNAKYMLWDESEDTLAIAGSATIDSVPVVSSSGPYGTGADGTVSNITNSQDWNGTTVAQSGGITLDSNRTIRATSTITLSQATVISPVDGQDRGSYSTVWGSPGIELGAIFAALGSKGIPVPIKPGGDTDAMCGGVVQMIAGGNVVVGGTITANAATAGSSDGGGGGGLVVIISGGTISGSSAISVAGAAANSTAAAKGGSGSYSGAPGGHAGIAGSGGGGGGSYFGGGGGGASGSGMIAGNSGGSASGGSNRTGGGGGSLDNAGTNGGSGGMGDGYLADYGNTQQMTRRAVVATSGAGGHSGGTNGGGGGGGAYVGGAGGAATALGGSGGGGGAESHSVFWSGWNRWQRRHWLNGVGCFVL
jgi:hypothetical protein